LLLWIIIALLTAAAVMAVLAPLGRAAIRSGHADQSRKVYVDQLKELEDDLAEGRISAGEAEGARSEIARRLIAADKGAAETSRPEGSIIARRATALVALIGIPLLSLGVYLSLGAPHLPGQSLAARLNAPTAPGDIETLLARVEDHLAREPEDGAGWDVIAPVYLRLGRAADAQAAYRNAIRILGSNAARQSGLGEAIFAAEGGIVTADARAAFVTANQADPAAPGPRFFLALAEEQSGNPQEAAKRWRALLAEAGTAGAVASGGGTGLGARRSGKCAAGGHGGERCGGTGGDDRRGW
jgi:cytochrome c-type biogenesis protein CcmH